MENDYQREQIKQTAFKPVEVERGIFWVGYVDFDAGFSNNPYLIVEDKDAMLVDPGPGSPQLFKIILKKVRSILNGKTHRIKFLVCSHRDPDVCASLPLWEEYVNPNAAILATSRTITFLSYYGTNLKMIPVKEGDIIVLGGKRNLKVIQTPYVHAAGSMMLYDLNTGTLFSQDLFGALSVDFELFADSDYLSRAINFATVFFGSRDALRDTIMKLRELDIKTICPQHGSVIKSHIKTYFDVFQHLEPAELLRPGKKEPEKSDFYEMLKRAEENLKIFYGDSVDIKSILEKAGFYKALANKYISGEDIKDIGWNIFKYYGDVPYIQYLMGVSKYACEKKIKNPIFVLPNEITWEKVKSLPSHTPRLISNIMNRYVEKQLAEFITSEDYEEYVKEKMSTTTAMENVETSIILNISLSGIGGKKYSAELDDLINTYMISIINSLKEFGARFENIPGMGIIATFGTDEAMAKNAFVCALAVLYRVGRINRRKERSEIDVRIGMAQGKVIRSKDGKDIVGEGVNTAYRLKRASSSGTILLLKDSLEENIQGILSLSQYKKYFKFKEGSLVMKGVKKGLEVIKVERI